VALAPIVVLAFEYARICAAVIRVYLTGPVNRTAGRR
jgi:hypothetical protein